MIARQETPLQAIQELVAEAIDLRRLETGRKRQELVLQGARPDYAPLLLGHTHLFVGNVKEDRSFKLGDHLLTGGLPTPEIEDYPHFTSEEQISSPKIMLYEALWEVLGWARTPSDTQLSVRPNLIFLIPTCFGMRYRLTEDGTAYFPNPISIDQALNASLEHPESLGEMPRVIECLDFFRQNVPEGVRIECPIAVGPLSLIDQLLGEHVWTLFYEQPEKIRTLLDKVTSLLIRLLCRFKEAVDEPVDSAAIGPLHLSRGGAKIGSDSLVMLSPRMFEDFILPAIQRMCHEFKGACHHSCGFYPKHLKLLNNTPGLTVINFGQPELWEMASAVREMHESGKVYYGGWQRLPGEPIEAYLRRGVELCGPMRNRAVLSAKGEGPWPAPEKIMDMWQRLQDEMFPV